MHSLRRVATATKASVRAGPAPTSPRRSPVFAPKSTAALFSSTMSLRSPMQGTTLTTTTRPQRRRQRRRRPQQEATAAASAAATATAALSSSSTSAVASTTFSVATVAAVCAYAALVTRPRSRLVSLFFSTFFFQSLSLTFLPKKKSKQ